MLFCFLVSLFGFLKCLFSFPLSLSFGLICLCYFTKLFLFSLSVSLFGILFGLRCCKKVSLFCPSFSNGELFLRLFRLFFCSRSFLNGIRICLCILVFYYIGIFFL